MPGSKVYKWSGTTKAGTPANGELASTDIALAKAHLQRHGITVNSIRQQLSYSLRKQIKPSEINSFTRELATMVAAGIPISQALSILQQDQKPIELDKVINSIIDRVTQGEALSTALTHHPKQFNKFFTGLVNAGEKSGKLPEMLNWIADYREKNLKLQQKIYQSLAYPVMILITAILVVGLLLVYIIPQFEQTFITMNAELPAVTQMVINLASFIQYNWYLFLIFPILLTVAIRAAYSYSHKLQLYLDRLALNLPVVGKIFKSMFLSRFSKALSMMLQAGIPIVTALKIVQQVGNNSYFNQLVQYIIIEISAGERLHSAMKNQGIFPDSELQLILAGEESGKLEQLLATVAKIEQDKVNNKAKSITALLEPVVIIIVGLIVGAIVVAVYLPIFNMGRLF